MSMEQNRITLGNGIELDVVDTGPRDAPALVFLHGFPDSHRTWRHQIAQFSDRYRCIAPDQRGYRHSSKPEGVANYTPDKMIGDVFQLADALGLAQFTVVGHDWGGAIAWGVALLGQKTRVPRAVICNAPHPVLFQKLLYTNPVQRAASQYMRVFRDTDNDAMVRQFGLTAILAKGFGEGTVLKALPDDHEQLLAEYMNPDAAIAMLNWYRGSPLEIPAMDAPFEIPASYTPPAIPPLDIPTLVVWAMDDIALPPENLDGLEDSIRDLTVVKVPDSGHFVQWEQPQMVNAAIEEFLARTGG